MYIKIDWLALLRNIRKKMHLKIGWIALLFYYEKMYEKIIMNSKQTERC